MMALTTNKKNKIIAEWKAGKYENINQVASAHKIDYTTAKKIIGTTAQTNADIVEVGTIYETAKKSIKNQVELKAIESLIIERTIADEIEEVALSGTLANLKSVKKKIELEELATAQDHLHAQNTFDKALITAGKADRHAKSGDVNVQTNTAVQIDKKLSKEELEAEIIKRGLHSAFIGH